jgi:hypothetical protein
MVITMYTIQGRMEATIKNGPEEMWASTWARQEKIRLLIHVIVYTQAELEETNRKHEEGMLLSL